MKADILEQITENWLIRQPGTFTKSNVRYRPSRELIDHLSIESKRKYNVTSDIDLMAVRLSDRETKEVVTVNCKSWQHGFHVTGFYDSLMLSGEAITKHSKHFRELVDPIWGRAFSDQVYAETGTRDFTYYIAVTKLMHAQRLLDFENNSTFIGNLGLSEFPDAKIQIKFIDLKEMVFELYDGGIGTTPESTELGRFLQLMKAAKISILSPETSPLNSKAL